VPGLKVAMDLLGFYGGPVRSPLLPITDDEKASLKLIIENAGLLK